MEIPGSRQAQPLKRLVAALGDESQLLGRVETTTGKVVLTGSEGSTLCVWNLTNGQSIANFEAPKPPAEEKK